jgi:hypothetical protein
MRLLHLRDVLVRARDLCTGQAEVPVVLSVALLVLFPARSGWDAVVRDLGVGHSAGFSVLFGHDGFVGIGIAQATHVPFLRRVALGEQGVEAGEAHAADEGAGIDTLRVIAVGALSNELPGGSVNLVLLRQRRASLASRSAGYRPGISVARRRRRRRWVTAPRQGQNNKPRCASHGGEQRYGSAQGRRNPLDAARLRERQFTTPLAIARAEVLRARTWTARGLVPLAAYARVVPAPRRRPRPASAPR